MHRTTCVVMAYMVMAYVFMAYIVMAFVVAAYVFMQCIEPHVWANV